MFVSGIDYRILLLYMRIDEAIILFKNPDLTEKGGMLWRVKNYYHIWKMGKEIITFGDIETEKTYINFTNIKILFFLKDVDVGNILISNKISFCLKNYINTSLVTQVMIIKLYHSVFN